MLPPLVCSISMGSLYMLHGVQTYFKLLKLAFAGPPNLGCTGYVGIKAWLEPTCCHLERWQLLGATGPGMGTVSREFRLIRLCL